MSSNMISEFDCKRIKNDAEIAIDALLAIKGVANECRLHPNYLKEKLTTVKDCIEFISSFIE